MNTKRSRQYMKIKRSINSCVNHQQLQTVISMISNHKDSKEAEALLELYNKQNVELNPDLHEEEIVTAFNRHLCSENNN